MQMTHKADLLTEGIVKKLNLLIAADQLTGYALTVRAPGEQEAMYGAGSVKRGQEEMIVWAAKFIAAVAKDRREHPASVAQKAAEVAEYNLMTEWERTKRLCKAMGLTPPPPPFCE